MKKQKGVALIVVMSLLAVSLMIGLMSMQTSQVDERLAGNYKAAAEAQMAAEYGAAERLSGSSAHSESRSCDEAQKYPSHSVGKEEWSVVQEVGSGGAYYRYIRCEEDGVKSTLVMGCVGSAGQDLSCRFVRVSDAGGEITGDDVADFLDWLDANFPDDAIRECDVDSFSGPGVYFCDGEFDGGSQVVLDGEFNDMVLISRGNMEFRVADDVEGLTLVTLGSVTFRGVGSQDEVSGDVWSGGDVTIRGGGGQEFEITICASGDATVSGGSLADHQGCSWAADLADDLNYAPGGRSWTQL